MPATTKMTTRARTRTRTRTRRRKRSSLAQTPILAERCAQSVSVNHTASVAVPVHRRTVQTLPQKGCTEAAYDTTVLFSTMWIFTDQYENRLMLEWQ